MIFTNAYDDPILYENENAVICSDLEFWNQLIHQYNPNNILEIGCGTGRIAKAIITSDIKYTGIDLSKEFINYFKMSIPNSHNVNLVLGDACKYVFNSSYDCIILPANFISHIQKNFELEELFCNLKKHLTSNGKIIIDYFNPQIHFLDMRVENELCYKFFINKDEISVYETHKYNSLTQINNIIRVYYCDSQKVKEVILPMRIYFFM